jgi:purine nucleosidase
MYEWGAEIRKSVTMSKIPLLVDCDPGLDDAIAILLAIASPDEIDILGITTVFGNGPAERTQKNARRICQLTGRTDIPVTQGCPRPMHLTEGRDEQGDTEHVEGIHGDTGLGGLCLPDPTMPLNPMHSVDFIIQTIKNSDRKITLTPTGSMTNVACALIMAPEIADNIEKIVLMGGVIGTGNITPAAECNFYTDPHAAAVLITSGIPIVMMGLDITRQVQTTEAWLAEIKAMNTPVSQAVVDMLSYYHRPDAYLEPGVTGGVLHDPNVIGYLLNPELYSGRNVYVEVSTSNDITAGRSTVDWWNRLGKKPNALVIDQVDSDAFFKMLTERLARLGC